MGRWYRGGVSLVLKFSRFCPQGRGFLNKYPVLRAACNSTLRARITFDKLFFPRGFILRQNAPFVLWAFPVLFNKLTVEKSAFIYKRPTKEACRDKWSAMGTILCLPLSHPQVWPGLRPSFRLGIRPFTAPANS